MEGSSELKVFDCFIFNGEFDTLELRLRVMNPFVDMFILVESKLTFTGNDKNETFKSQAERFDKYSDKLIVITLEELPSRTNAWENEFFMRNALMSKCPAKDDDFVLVSDVDEIINLEHILPQISNEKAYLIEIPCYYYYSNVVSNELCLVNYFGPYGKIKNRNIGNRLEFITFVDHVLYNKSNAINGMHLTYQFGEKIESYQTKIESFSHQEYNTKYFKDYRRLRKCIRFQIDLLERWKFSYRINSSPSSFEMSVYEQIDGMPKTSLSVQQKNILNKILKPFVKLTFQSYFEYNIGILKSRIVFRKMKLARMFNSK